MTITRDPDYVPQLPEPTVEVLRIMRELPSPNLTGAELERVLRVAYLRGYRNGLEDMRRSIDENKEKT